MFKWRRDSTPVRMAAAAPKPDLNGYAAEFTDAWGHTLRFGLDLPPIRFQVRKDCIDVAKARAVIGEYFSEHSPEALMGQTLLIYTTLQPRLHEALGVPLYLTIGWIELDRRPRMKHGDDQIRMFSLKN
jgi:hypothetical protein